MLNIDYSTKGRFLISLGITMIFIGCLFYLATSVFFLERVDKVQEEFIRNALTTEEEQINTILLKNFKTIKIISITCLIIAWVMIIGGLLFSLSRWNLMKKKKWK